MKRNTTILVDALMTLAVTTAQEAGAEWWKINHRETREAKAQRLDRMPTMGFCCGTLHAGIGGQWELNGVPVGLAPDCTITQVGSDRARLQDGAPVILMGEKVGGGILARQVMIQKSDDFYYGQALENPSVVWSESDPTVGEGGPAEF